MKKLLAALGLFLALATTAFASDIMVMSAMAPASLTPAAQTAAVYLMLMNHGSASDKLVKAETPVAAAAEVHETQMEGDVMKMRPVGVLDVPGGAHIMFEPGKMHIMLTGLKAPLKEGDTFPLDLTFETAGVVRTDVMVGKAVGGHDHGQAEEAN